MHNHSQSIIVHKYNQTASAAWTATVASAWRHAEAKSYVFACGQEWLSEARGISIIYIHYVRPRPIQLGGLFGGSVVQSTVQSLGRGISLCSTVPA